MKTNHFKAVIVDDEKDAREIIALLIEQAFPSIEVVDKADGVSRAVEAILRHDPDLVFLDISMADGSGFDLLARLPDLHALVIFVSAHDNFAMKAIKASAFDYMLKPIDADEFRYAVNKALGKLESRRAEKRQALGYDLEVKKIGIPNLTGYNFVDVQTIVRCEADGHYTTIHFIKSPKVVVSKSLLHFEDELIRHGFFRNHHKHLVNLNFITAYSKGKGGGSITMADGCELEVSSRKKAELLKMIAGVNSERILPVP
ncbi:MAG: response regulator transcription factor [Bacteroidota bacterium]